MYTVSWTDEASDQLVELWLAATNRDDVTRCAADIERNLASRPLEAGESRDGGLRILISRPLAVYYEVRELDRLVGRFSRLVGAVS